MVQTPIVAEAKDLNDLGSAADEEGHRQTYSVLSVLDNIALHDREHAAQIEEILAH